jgi:hypothetical protein
VAIVVAAVVLRPASGAARAESSAAEPAYDAA